MTWSLDFYEQPDGTAPVERFLDSLSDKARAKALAILKSLETTGFLPFPYSSQVSGKIRELRTQFGKEKIRILYYGASNQHFVLLHGLIKNSDKLDKSDIAIAVRNMDDHQARLARNKVTGRKK